MFRLACVILSTLLLGLLPRLKEALVLAWARLLTQTERADSVFHAEELDARLDGLGPVAGGATA